MNAGLQWGIDHGFTVLSVLNDDTVGSSAAFDRLAAAADADHARVVCPRVDYLAQRPDAWFVGARLDPDDRLPRHLSVAEFEELPRSTGGLVEVELVTGCCVTASTEAWLATGGFDERYFLYFEDSDWSMHARQVGLQLYIDPQANIKHTVSASSTGAAAYLTSFYFSRNLLLFGTAWPQAGLRPWTTWWVRSVRPTLRDVRRDPASAARHGTMVLLGASARLARTTGPAPSPVVRAARLMVRGHPRRRIGSAGS